MLKNQKMLDKKLLKKLEKIRKEFMEIQREIRPYVKAKHKGPHGK